MDAVGFGRADEFVFQTSDDDGNSYRARETADVLMHELGHLEGLYPDTYDGIDSEEAPYSEYRSVMNYDAPWPTVRYNDAEPFDDWEYIRNNINTPSIAD